ncbi:DDT domain-containing protein [Vigna angularis]|uniref:DDT domain-containing protein n=1 Tax=Phaseolus angularis TaxID=3914 RepID=A0A8T0KL78_PHAAN|nr:DDT domain-containing protein [Vigna angularis]
MQAAEEGGDNKPMGFDGSDLDKEIFKLRGRWELASILNFLEVFNPILGNDLKLSAEDIEIGLVKPDASLARLHIQLLKVAEGEIPLVPSKGYDATSKGQSHRLYREVIKSDSIPKDEGNRHLSLPSIQWETLASNLEEFAEVAKKFSFSKSSVKVSVSTKLQSNVIPALEKLREKKEKTMKKKQRQDMLLKDIQNSYCSGNTRACRTRRPICYTFEAYDRTITEAIQLTNKRKRSPVADQDKTRQSEDQSKTKDVSTDSDSERDIMQISDDVDAGYEVENDGISEEENFVDGELVNSEALSSHAVSYPKGVRCSKRLAGVPSHAILESRGLTTKQTLRQRPTRNSALESIMILDSEDEEHDGKTDLSDSI